MIFRKGDKVTTHTKPGKLFIVESAGLLAGHAVITLRGEYGIYQQSQFSLVSRALELLREAEKRAATDPNDEMLTEDEDEGKAEEFLDIMRKREYEKRVKGLREPLETNLADVWDSEHLSNAIEKTTSTAQHPQAMWGL